MVVLTAGEKYHNFTYIGETRSVGPNSSSKGLFLCSCGKTKSIRIDTVTRGMKNCGLCSQFLLNPNDKIGEMWFAGPEPLRIQPGSSKKLPFRCACNKVSLQRLQSITTGHTSTCGSCNDFQLRTGDSYHGFEYDGDDTFTSPGSHKKLLFRCKCGKTKKIKICHISSGLVKSCGSCSTISLKYGDPYFDFIYVGPDVIISKWEKIPLPFKCRCGNTKSIRIAHLTSRNTKTCGDCRSSVFRWFVRNRLLLTSLKTPIRTANIPHGGVEFLEEVIANSQPSAARCPACWSIYNPRFSDVKRGLSLTCGCTSNRISSENLEIMNFIQSLGYRAIPEFRVGGYDFDIHPVGTKILIEYHGLYWHSSEYSISLDQKKKSCAEQNGFVLITINETDWKKERHAVEGVLCRVLGVKNGLSTTD